ncbi:MAG TPA: 5-(carboxyamino)imidazole ribonucleotide synthase [Acidimicrobiia bacterium]|nr:5-(carboxyamino)imidazole ribonucleotide synthase [Acidimicrobiia bacterium]
MVDHPLRPSAVVGVVGGGQLARMMAQAAGPLGIDLRVLGGPSDEGAATVAPIERGDITDPGTLERFAAACDVLTFDHELVPIETVRHVEEAGHAVRPGSASLRLSDKALLREALAGRFPLPPHTVAHAASEAVAFGDEHGWPVVVKAARGGYDGRGVNVAENAQDVALFMHALDEGVPAVVEPVLDLEAELAVVVVRRPGGEMRTYPVVRTIQVDGQCHEVAYPAGVERSVEEAATRLAGEVAETIGAVGILAVECFVVDGEVLLNEIAPRPHNSGHWTIDGAVTSQFENHLRAVLDRPLGSTEPSWPAVTMLNLIPGDPPADPRDHVAAALATGAHVHVYDKTPRPGRKVGHVTATGSDPGAVRAQAIAAAASMGSITAGGSP